MGTPQFPDLGKYCSLPGCKQIDFLPFTCDCCPKIRIHTSLGRITLKFIATYQTMINLLRRINARSWLDSIILQHDQVSGLHSDHCLKHQLGPDRVVWAPRKLTCRKEEPKPKQSPAASLLGNWW
ncbi:hypothetical protein CUMW_149650 [Citrus unshiu]|nr:hypothetical protein CUMW_149650 [Citrus unshiu]